MLNLRLLFLFLYGIFCGVIAIRQFIEFTKFEDLGGFTCPADQTVFEEENKGSLAQCVLKCSVTSRCYGVFHQLHKMHCIGCRYKFLTKDGAPLLNGTLYYRRQQYRVVDEKKQWDVAQKYCEDLGEHLADIKSEAEGTFLERYVFHGYNESFWLGATDVESEGTFVWRDGTNVSDFYVNWGPSQPNNANGIEHCLKTVKVNDEWKWRDGKCYSKLFSLCEFD